MIEPAHVRESWLHRYTAGGEPREGWREQAECRGAGPTMWYPSDGEVHQTPAFDICHTCPVRLDCLQDAFESERFQSATFIFGIRGGLSARARSRWLASHPEVRPDGWQTPHVTSDATILEHAEQGLTVREIAAKFDLTSSYVHRRVRKANAA